MMTTAERMKARRKEIGVSAEEIAKELKVSPATVYRYENGDIEKMPLEILEPLSKILKTTPAYLMGWEEASDSCVGKNLKELRKSTGLSDDDILNVDEIEHIKKYRRIDSDGRATIDMMLDQLVQKAEAECSATHPVMITLPLASRGSGVSEVTMTKEEFEKGAEMLEDACSDDIDF